MTAKSILRVSGDWTSLIAAMHEPGGSDAAWGSEIVRAAASILPNVVGLAILIVEHSPDCRSAKTVTASATAGFEHLLEVNNETIAAMGLEGFQRYFFPPYPVTTHREVERGLPPEITALTHAYRRQLGIVDALGIVAHPEPGTVVVLSAALDAVPTLSRHERGLLARVGLHLETSYRLRRRPEIVKAVLDAKGRVLSRSDDAPSARVLSSHAALVGRALSRRRSASSEAVGLWPALISGHCSLVERGEGREKRYLVVENSPGTRATRALSAPEIDVISRAARGLSTKLIAYALGLSSPTVSSRLASAASKIGAASREELVRLAAVLTRDPRGGFAEPSLTSAESDVLELLQRGLSNEAIAKMRSRSVRTIANQVASLLRKTQSPSRRALIVMPRAPT